MGTFKRKGSKMVPQTRIPFRPLEAPLVATRDLSALLTQQVVQARAYMCIKDHLHLWLVSYRAWLSNFSLFMTRTSKLCKPLLRTY
jgi:hypothetical protein